MRATPEGAQVEAPALHTRSLSNHGALCGDRKRDRRPENVI